MGSIANHLSNFIDTWEGWAKIINGLYNFSFSGIFGNLKSIFDASKVLLSSK
ncbi:hypothetical protein [Corynebacterium diphtheriae]|uniref:hypothetical protein n=1 Tax=Corynebacterium diphtheriae TaxID=1717 RepID=UPI000B0D061E|nr:hypothetical protein [Corynebacterium diphtheriae]MBG9221938.1 hypothetical protein [Corynebacterium diphtheriae bv. mitis]MBG9301213.1 hypothetical protein [Corynebacterium diphtheriae bv. mitis]CAB0615866.1 hypothetical protein CIP107543_01896 [Corynebacterium diphtheriae]